MRIVVQRVNRSQVSVGDNVVSKAGAGIMALVGITRADNDADVTALARKLCNLRVFATPAAPPDAEAAASPAAPAGPGSWPSPPAPAQRPDRAFAPSASRECINAPAARSELVSCALL